MSHLKAYAAPTSWNILRKVNKWITRPRPGAHPLERALPVGILLKHLNLAKTTKEAKHVVNAKAVKVDSQLVKNLHCGVGFMDTIQIGDKVSLRCGLDTKGRLTFNEAPKEELNKKICKIKNKRTVNAGKIQLNMTDGRNILLAKNEYAVGDSLLIEIPSQKVVEHLPLTKGNTAILVSGRHIGVVGTIDEIKEDRIWLKDGKEKIETLKQFAFVIGKAKPSIKL